MNSHLFNILLNHCIYNPFDYSKACVKLPLKNRQIKDLGSLMKVESIAECSTWSILQYF